MIADRKLRKILSLFIVLFVSTLAPVTDMSHAWAQDGQEFRLAPVNPEFIRFLEDTPESFYGYIPSPMDLSHLDRIPVEAPRMLATLPSRFDWRDAGKVTSVRDQNPCGTCWAHGTLAALESRVLIRENTTYDFSEQNLLCCTDPAWEYLIGNRCMGGGWSWLAADTLSKKGTRLESCQPYNTNTLDTEPCNDSCATIKVVTAYRMIANQATSPDLIAPIKNALYNHGPLAMSYCHDDAHLYPGNIYYWPNCPQSANHLVCLIGWDDSVTWPGGGGSGAWIVKNSWGTGWGDNGFFYLCYGSASMCEVSSLDYKDYDLNETLYYWDEVGQLQAIGCNAESAWMANIFTASQAGSLTHVDFWTTSNNAAYEIYVYLDGDISNGLQNLATSQTGTCQEFGYYSIPLSSPVALTSGQAFTVAVKMTTPGYNYPIPVEVRIEQQGKVIANPAIQTGKSFARCSDTDSWDDLAGSQANACLRARVNTGIAPGQPDIAVDPTSFGVTLAPNISQSYALTVSNEGNGSLTFSISDTATTGSGLVSEAKDPARANGSSLAQGNSSWARALPLPPLDGVEISYDDGVAEDYYWWELGYAGGLFAVKFTPPQYPATLKVARFCLEPNQPDSDHEQFAVEIYDDNGAGGAPGTLLGGGTLVASSWGWVDVNLSSLNITITSGSFYVAYKQLTDYPNCEALCADYTSPDGRSWAGYGGEWHPVEWYGINLDWLIRCVVEAGPSNSAPNCPSNPSPANHATGVSVNADLSWTGGDPDPGDTVTYDVYFGTAATPPLASSHQTATTYDPGTLTPNTKYYWKIVATDSHGASTTGPVWDFTTAAQDCPWLDESPKSGSVPAGGSASITVTINTTGLTAGSTYTAQIVIANNDPDENPKIVPVTLHVSSIACQDNPPVAVGLASISDKLVLAYGFKQGEGQGGWTIYNPAWASSHPEWNTLTTLYKRRGYWIKVSQACNLVYGSNTYQLDAGWNLIGWCGC